MSNNGWAFLGGKKEASAESLPATAPSVAVAGSVATTATAPAKPLSLKWMLDPGTLSITPVLRVLNSAKDRKECDPDYMIVETFGSDIEARSGKILRVLRRVTACNKRWLYASETEAVAMRDRMLEGMITNGKSADLQQDS